MKLYNCVFTDGYSTENLVFEWNPKPVSRDARFALAQFSLEEMRTMRCDKTYVGGTDGDTGDVTSLVLCVLSVSLKQAITWS